jgi:trimethylamine--corrinoid protein Co-methyltransferase
LKPFEALSSGQVAELRTAAEDVLENTGFCVQHDGLLRKARAAGARVDEASGRVRMSAPLLRELLAQAPARYCIRDCVGGSFEVGGGKPGVFAITNDPWIVDYETREVRHPRLDDVRRHTAIAQQLDCVVCMSCMDYPVTDFDDASSILRALETHLLHHAKHNAVLPSSVDRFRMWLDLGKILNRGEDLAGSGLMTCGVPVISPLTLTRANAELLLMACERGLPVLPTICPMAGTTAPYSLASTLLVGHCESLLMAAMTQILRPGNPFQYAMGPSVSDMRAGENLYYTLDKVLWKTAGVQLAKACGLPCSAECGGTMTHRYDPQNGAEGMLFMLAARASGADILAGLGSCYNANGMSAEMMLIQETWLHAAEFLCKGVDTSRHALGIENIKAAGPGAHFLTDDLTLESFRGGAFFEDALLDYSGGYHKGVPLLDRAHQRAEELVSNYESPVPGNIQEGLRRYFHDRYARV